MTYVPDPAHPAQPEFQRLGSTKFLITQNVPPSLSRRSTTSSLARDIGLCQTFIDVLVDEQHPAAPGLQSAQQLPEPLEPARRHMRQPRREDHIEPGS